MTITVINSNWKTAADGVFSIAGNWTPSGAPNGTTTSEYYVFIGGAFTSGTSAFTVTSNANTQIGSLDVEANATLAISSGVFKLFSNVNPYSNIYNFGAINVAAGATLTLGAAHSPSADSSELQNIGSVSIAGTMSLAAPWFGLFGKGILTLTGVINGANTGSVAQFTVKGSTIQGSGYLGAGSMLSLTNGYGGLINANTASQMSINTSTNLIHNQGTIETTGTGGLVLHSNMQLDGALNANGVGALTIMNAYVQGGGAVNVGAGGALNLNSGQISSGGVISIAAKGTVRSVTGNTTGIGSSNALAGDALQSGEIEDAGTIAVSNDSTLNLNASVHNVGFISINGSNGPTKLEVFNNGLTLFNTGGVFMTNSANNAIVSNGSSVTLSNNTKIVGAGVIGDTWLRLSNHVGAMVAATDSTSLTIVADTAGVTSGGEGENYNAGTIINVGAGGLILSGGSLSNAGYITEDGSGAITLKGDNIDNGGGIVRALVGTIVLQGNSEIFNQAYVSLAANTTLTTTAGDTHDAVYGFLFNGGAVNVVAGSTLFVDGHWTNNAVINVGSASTGATIEVSNSSNWELQGSGSVNMSNANDRILSAAPGAVLQDKGNLISGGGVIGDGNMTVDVQSGGKIDATLSTGLTLNATAQDTSTGQTFLYNAGILQSDSAGGLTIGAAIYSPGQLIANSGAKIVAQSAVYGVGATTINGSGSVEFHAEVDNDVHFGAQTGGDLILDSSNQFYGAIFGLAGGDTIDLRDFAFVAGSTHIDTATSGFGSLDAGLRVTNGASDSASLFLQGNYTAANLTTNHLAFQFASDGHLIGSTGSDGTLVKLVATA